MNRVVVVTALQALEQTYRSLGVPFESRKSVPCRACIAQSIRRAAFSAAPCSAQVLRSLVFVALSPLTDSAEPLKANIEEVLEDLIAIGDILEMRTEMGDRWQVVLRPAPPAFVERRDGTFLLLGVAGDEITPEIGSTLIHQDSGLRCVRPDDVRACRDQFLELGLIELSERLWLFAPEPNSAPDVVAHWKAKLPADAMPEKIEGIELLQPASITSFYKGRWTTLQPKLTGIFVARRPQRYGAKLWCIAEVKDGVVQRFVDIRARNSRTRDCDEAWRLQAALDATAGTPQSVRVLECGSVTTLAFVAPLPAWAARRLSFIGKPANVPRALLAFDVPTANTQDELQWLNQNLWLTFKFEGEAV